MSPLPLYIRVRDLIRADLLAGGEPAGEVRLPSERELQDRYGVSRPTISKALASLAGAGFLVITERRGTLIAPLEPAPGTQPAGVPRLIGYVGSVGHHILPRQTLLGIDRVARRAGFRMIAATPGGTLASERSAVEDMLASGVAGLIVYPMPRRQADRANDYLPALRTGAPTVLVDTCGPRQGHSQVLFDNRRAGRRVAELLLARGRRRMGVLLYSRAVEILPLVERLAGVEDAVADAGLPEGAMEVREFTDEARAADIRRIVAEWMAGREPVNGIIAADDHTAMEAIDLLQQMGRRVPEDVLVAGFDNLAPGLRFRPAFPSTRPDFERMGEVAAEMVVRAVADGGRLAPTTSLLDLPLVVR